MANRKAKVDFSEEEKLKLMEAYEGGMDSVAKDKFPKIRELALNVGKDESAIKVCSSLKVCKY